MLNLQTRNVLILIVLAVVVLAACSSPTPTPPPTPTEPVLEDEWSRIQEAGTIVVGTSADYPPFAFYTGTFAIDGFDIALMNEIGERMGVEVEFHDFAFDGLGGALMLDQIDAAIAALSVTPERARFVDFSDTYYMGEDAILAQEDSTIGPIRFEEDLTGHRVAVQTGSVYEDWLETELVETGLMLPSDVFAYGDLKMAIADLIDGSVDLVVLDFLPAQSAINQGGVKLVGQGLNRQRFGIAMRKGATSLRDEINSALAQLYSEGVISQLAEQYLYPEPPEIATPEPPVAPTSEPAPATPEPPPATPEPPPATPEPPPATPTQPPPTPEPEVSCIDGMAHVQDLTYDDLNMEAPPEIPAGQPFVKTWRVRNAGTCPWDTSYALVFVQGNVPVARMGKSIVAIDRIVAPGEEYDISVGLVAPLNAGVFQGIWQMRNDRGVPFGQRIWVGIRVPGQPTATPPATQTPSPEIGFRADRTRISAGECTTIRWEVENIKEVFFYAQGERWERNGVVGRGSRQVCPPTTTVYELRVVKPDNSVEVRQLRIDVEPVVGAPVINRFTVDPAHQITLGQCVDIRWDVQGSVSRIRIQRSGGNVWDGAPSSGSYQDCPPNVGNVEYAIEASGSGGTSRLNRNVNVVSAATATPVPTPVPQEPVINAFSVSPNNIRLGESVSISWDASGGTTMVQLRRNGVVIQDRAGLGGRVTDIPTEVGQFTYRLEAYGAGGQTVSREENVSVAEPEPERPPNPLAGTSWRATNYFDGSAMASVLEGTTLTASFGEGGDVSGSAGCNTYGASYTVVGESLMVSAVAASQKLCDSPEGIMQQEQAFLSALQTAASFAIEGNTLFVRNGSNEVLLELVRQ